MCCSRVTLRRRKLSFDCLHSFEPVTWGSLSRWRRILPAPTAPELATPRHTPPSRRPAKYQNYDSRFLLSPTPDSARFATSQAAHSRITLHETRFHRILEPIENSTDIGGDRRRTWPPRAENRPRSQPHLTPPTDRPDLEVATTPPRCL